MPRRPFPVRFLRSARTLLLATALLVSFSAGFAARALVDDRLFLAHDALENARALLLASTPGGATDPRAVRTFQRHVGKAISAIETATGQVEQAIAVVEAAE
jgi:hypothetical protein